eukprot:NODE_9788_length_1399_cov_11.783019.p1 GENE.NODE_9788_length_1399_cov_11.783019~~NODE_9788_length_1399_cov_11.783019.p1  ORF type:complete len:244 (+),score=74.88 NODE_9788_length_1399_cov_11.783019:458-1189(+)
MVIGEVRFQSAEGAAAAVASLDGTDYLGVRISVKHDLTSKDGTRLLIGGLPLSASWQGLKQHFTSIGDVAYTSVTPLGAPQPAVRTEPGGKGEVAYTSVTPLGAPKPALGTEPGGKGIGKSAATGQSLGEVWFYDAQTAATATELFDGSLLHGVVLRVLHDRQDTAKVQILNLPASCARQELKDTFTCAGHVAFAAIHIQGQAPQRAAPLSPRDPGAALLQPPGRYLAAAAATSSLPLAPAPA